MDGDPPDASASDQTADDLVDESSPEEVAPRTIGPKAERDADETTLARWVGRGAPIALAVQLAIADAVFISYCVANSWQVGDRVMVGWLAATVVEVVGVVLVITKSLFPAGGRD